jgi:hypothetical protein
VPVELQVVIAKHALNEDMKNPWKHTCLRLYPYQTHKITKRGKYIKSRFIHPIIKLLRLPTVYHINRLFRAEALRIQPLRQLELKLDIRQNRRNPNVVFDSADDMVVLNFHHLIWGDTILEGWEAFKSDFDNIYRNAL